MVGSEVAYGLGWAIGAARVPGRDVVVFVEGAGRISSWDAVARSVDQIGTGWSEPEGIAVAADGTTAFVTERSGDVLEVHLGAANRADVAELASGFDAPHQPVLSADGTVLFVVEFGPTGQLLRIDLASGGVDVVTAGLEGAAGLALSPDGATAYVTEQAASGGRLSRVDVGSGATDVVLAGLIAPFFLAWADGLPDGHGGALDAGTVLLLVERDPANRVSVVNLTAGSPARRTVETVGFRPSSVVPLGDRLYVFAEHELTELDVSSGLEPSVRLRMPPYPLFIGGWARVGVEVGGDVAFDDLDFEVDGAPVTGGTSPSRDATFDPDYPEVMLLAGAEPGRFAFRAVERATGTELAQEWFEVSTEWPDEQRGAPVQFVGRSRWFVTAAAWGGGPAGPQNFNVWPALGTRRVALILVDTTSARYPSDEPTLSGIRNEWQTELLGVTDPDGVVRGVRQYYRETSYGRYDIALVGNRVFGPFQLAGAFTDYYTWNPTRKLWQVDGNLFQACVTAAQGQIDFDQVDTLVCVMRTVPAAGTTLAQFAWPWAITGVTFTYTRPGVPGRTSRGFACLTMPDDWEARDPATPRRRTHETLVHEIGHNLGMDDLYMRELPGYDADVQARDVGGWDIMSQENPLPQLSLPHRMMVGWVQPNWIRSFDFRSSGGVDQTLTLHATELVGLGGPPAGRWAGIEVRRADGWNYYFEYRAGQVTQISDRALPTDRRVLGTDVTSPTFTVPKRRRNIILLPPDPDGDGPVLGTGTDYEETDTSGPVNFQFDVISTAPDSARVRVRYGAGGRPDPSIRPWPGGENWQSPDIIVSNARGGDNIPWAGQLNKITAKIKNRGNFVAINVQANFYVKDFTLGNAPETFIGRATRTIAPDATEDFAVTWAPPANTPENDAHYCIIVRIPLYQDPNNPAIVELTQANNSAQSNYTQFISSTASSSRRVMTSITVSNPYAEPARVFVVPQQSSDWYRTYLEHAWLWLEPGESRPVVVMVESLLGDPAFPELEEQAGAIYKGFNNISLVGLIENPHDPHLHAAEVMGGATMTVISARATRIYLSHFGEEVARGQVVTLDDGKPVTDGEVILSLKPLGLAENAEYRTGQGNLDQDGFFTIYKIGATDLVDTFGWVEGQAHYLGAFAQANCDSKVVRLER